MLSYMITFYYIITKFAQTTELRKFMKETDPQLSPRYEVVEQLKPHNGEKAVDLSLS